MPAPSRKKILLVSVNWMGDLLFLTPAIRAVRRAYPGSRIACLVPPRGMDLLRTHPHLDEVIPAGESRGVAGFFRWLKLVRRLRAGGFNTAILFHRSWTRALAIRLAGIPERIGYRTRRRAGLLTAAVEPPARDSVHKAVGFLQLLEGAGIPSDGLRYDVGLLPEDRSAAERLLREWGARPEDPLVALHAGANWRLKRWPAGRFAALGDELARRHGARVLLIGDRSDLLLAEKIRAQMRTPPIVAAGRTSFRELGALLTRVRLLISNDSGPLHLGLAVGTPVVGLFGPTDPKLSGPLENGKAASLFGSIGCPVPCYELRCPANLCMHEIRVEQVLEAAGRFLQGPPA